MRHYPNFTIAIRDSLAALERYGDDVDPGKWQGVSTEGKPDLVTREVLNWGIGVPVGRHHMSQPPGECMRADDLLSYLQHEIEPNLPWADLEFEDRISREPRNPHYSLTEWPWWQGQEGSTMFEGKFSHTYAERFWPKRATDETQYAKSNLGIRYKLGDLDDLVTMLLNNPSTRQAYLPIYFPEDTGAVHGGRIPCTLGYQFMLRENKMHMWYFIRSCDYVRHFRDDIYLACRLLLWVINEVQERWLRTDVQHKQNPNDWQPGYLYMTCCSLHYHKGDQHLLDVSQKRYVGGE